MSKYQGSMNALQGTEAPAQQIWPYNCSLHVGMNATSNRDHCSAKAFIKFGQLNSPSEASRCLLFSMARAVGDTFKGRAQLGTL